MATPTLIERIDRAVLALRAEKQRIIDQARTDAAAVDSKIDALQAAKATLTPEVETSYATLKAMGLFKEL